MAVFGALQESGSAFAFESLELKGNFGESAKFPYWRKLNLAEWHGRIT